MATSITNTDAVMLRARRRSITNAGRGISMTNTMLTASVGTIQSPGPPATAFSNFGLVAILSPLTAQHVNAPSLPSPAGEREPVRGIRMQESQPRQRRVPPESAAPLPRCDTTPVPAEDFRAPQSHASGLLP